MKIKLASSRWFAWYNMMPGSTPMLHVTGQLDVSNESDSARLEFAGIEKSIPPNLLLKVEPQTIYVPREPGDHVVTVHYSAPGSPAYPYGVIKVFVPGEREPVVISQIGVAY